MVLLLLYGWRWHVKRWCAYFGCILVLLFVVGCRQPEDPVSPLSTPWISPLPTLTQQTVEVAWVWPEGLILYHADETGVYQLYVAQDEQTSTLLTPDLPSAVEGNWSSDGQRIAFAATSGPDNIQVYTMRADGSDLALLPVDQPNLNWYPKWSPEGEMLLFVTNRDSNFEIYKATLDGKFMVNLTNHSHNDQEPDWSPDGQKIVFVSDREGGDGLYLMDADGNNIQQLLDGSWGCRYPRWSADGQQIVFTAKFVGISHIYIMNQDGSDVRKITERTGDNVMPSWIGNDRIIFSGDVGDTTWDLFVVNVDGSGLIQLTDTPYSERNPHWHP